ncbi:MAG: hypothetical protein KIT84_11885 [Labilithrix sp.]|nr:hypothetical protein [Labilithrix sp.]MCW5811711.1 hypothetical protein [Labilithrix sp.]
MFPRPVVAAFFRLLTVLAMLGVHATPAYAYSHTLGRAGVDTVEAAPTAPAGEREAVTARRSGDTPDARKLERSPRTSHHAPPLPLGPFATTPAAFHLSAELAEVLPPTTWIGWESAARARARLMVFLN